jgi:hypothetical protein
MATTDRPQVGRTCANSLIRITLPAGRAKPTIEVRNPFGRRCGAVPSPQNALPIFDLRDAASRCALYC